MKYVRRSSSVLPKRLVPVLGFSRPDRTTCSNTSAWKFPRIRAYNIEDVSECETHAHFHDRRGVEHRTNRIIVLAQNKAQQSLLVVHSELGQLGVVHVGTYRWHRWDD